MKNRKWLKILLILLAVVILGVVFSCQTNQNNSDESSEDFEIVDESENDLDETKSSSAAETTAAEKVCVHVCGSVKKPGVYYLLQGSRVHEAVEAAGGFTDDAECDYVNLAEAVADGQQIYIPTKEEAKNGEIESKTVSGNVSSQNDSGSLVDLNTADLSELTTLPGIGETKGQAIIDYRDNNGNFNSIDEITNVSGIGSSTFEKIKDYIKV